jgi:hypothetical protein
VFSSLLFILLSFFFRSLYHLSFFDLRLLIEGVDRGYSLPPPPFLPTPAPPFSPNSETEEREVGEEKFVKWEKTYPPPKKMWINNLRDLIFLVRRKGKGTNDENDHLRNKNLRKSIIDNKNTEKRIFVRICFSFYFFKR